MEISKSLEGRGVKLLDNNSVQPAQKPKRPKPPKPVDALWSIDEGCAFLGLSRWTVSAMLESGQLPGFILKSGKKKRIWRLRKSDLERWITAREQETKKIIHANRKPAVNLAVVNGGQDQNGEGL